MPADPSPAGSSSRTVGWLQRVWAELLDLDAYPAPEANFFSLGGTSLLTLSLLARIEEERGVRVPAIEVMALPDLAELAGLIDAGGRPGPRLLRRIGRPVPGLPVLVLVPGRRGLGIAFESTAAALRDAFNVFAFDYPGVQEGSAPRDTVEGMAEELVRAMREEALPPDFAIYGFSVGGWVALEAVRMLEPHGPRSVALGDITTAALRPQVRDAVTGPRFGGSSLRYWQLRSRLKRAALRMLGRPLDFSTDPRNPPLQAAIDEAMLGYRDRERTQDLLVLATPARRADAGDDLGWGQATSGTVETVAIGGSHDTIHETETAAIARALATYFLPRLRG